ncbi:DUF3558 domain-containing protein [Amycolatopsis sp. NPDC006131]|uniref:DUF3558 domain-containing protein n=1 Tax=Amycolatopsis sp. NPDC006131 TaxID=3156731 RepID=UPI0033A25222
MSKFRTLTGATLVSAVLFAAAACSDGGAEGTFPSGNPGSTPPDPPSTSEGTTGWGNTAPRVTDQLDPAGLVDSPCESLTAEQLDQLGVTGEGKETTLSANGVKGCDWKFGANLEWKIQVAYVVPDSKNGLQNVYDQNAAGLFQGGYFVPTSVAGYPGVFSNQADTRPDGRCDLAVGINSQMLLTSAVTGDVGKDNCKAASNVADRIVATIKAGGR